jgi:hypothetical protein
MEHSHTNQHRCAVPSILSVYYVFITEILAYKETLDSYSSMAA